MSILDFDIAAALVLAFLVDSIIVKKNKMRAEEKSYLLLLLLTFLATLFDIFGIYLNIVAKSGGSPDLFPLYFANTMYLLFHDFSIPMYLIFIITLSGAWYRLKKRKLIIAAMALPTVGITLALLTNLFTNKIFYFGEDRVYHRGELMLILYVCSFANMIICTLFLIKCRKLFSRPKFVALMSMLPLELCAIVVQWFFPDLLVEMFTNAVALFLAFTTVGRPEEVLEGVTQFKNLNAYETDTHRNFSNQKPFAAITIYISNFSALHQILGYDGSNELLKETAKRLSAIDEELGTRAALYHIQRGYFCFVLYGDHIKKAEQAAQLINEELKKSINLNGLVLNRFAYVCIINCPEDIGDPKTMLGFGLNINERLSYTGEVLYASELASNRNYELSGVIDKMIDDAIANRSFEVYYQPIYSVEKKRFVSAEALIRLRDEKYGFISPEFFITASERSGAIHKIGDFVMDEVCRFIASDQYKALGLEYIEVNLSVAQCMSPDLVEKIHEIMIKHKVTPDSINLEITETAMSSSQSTMTENIDRLREAGFTFSLDDYGTGYSNISRVAFLPLTIVKLDKSFVDSSDDPRMWTILQNTVKMIKDLDMRIVVEGIETKQMLEKFVDLECDYIQGYYFSRPLPKDRFTEFIRADIGE